MSTPYGILKLVDLTQPLTEGAQKLAAESLRKYGAFRVKTSQLSESDLKGIFSEANSFFNQNDEIKESTDNYSRFRSEHVRGKTAVPKETYYDRFGVTRPPSLRSLGRLDQAWIQFRPGILDMLHALAKDRSCLSQYSISEPQCFGIHHYVYGQLRDHDQYYNPPHVDGGLLTVLFQPPDDHSAYLEIADLDSTGSLGSEAIGRKAIFEKIAFETGEAIILTGLQAEKIFGLRACVHKVSRPDSSDPSNRLSLAIFLRLEKARGDSSLVRRNHP